MTDAERFRILRPLGVDGTTFAARDLTGPAPHRLVVLERVARATPTMQERAALVRRGRALTTLAHPNLVRVHAVIDDDVEVLIVSECVSGEWLAALMALDPRPPLDVVLRLVLDVLEGLGALHRMGDERGVPSPIIHGALSPETILVTEEGVAKIARTCRIVRAGSDGRYVAPELRRHGGTPDIRADIYSIGTILRDLLGVSTGENRYTEPLTEIAWRACSFDPESRWVSAATMSTALRHAVGARLAPVSRVAALMRQHFGAALRGRRNALEWVESEESPPSSAQSVRSSDLEVLETAPDSGAELTAVLPNLTTKAPDPRAMRPNVPAQAVPERTALPWRSTTQMGLAPPVDLAASVDPPTPRDLPTPPRDFAPPRDFGPSVDPSPPAVLIAATPPQPPVAVAPPPPSEDEDLSIDSYRRRLPTLPSIASVRVRVALQATLVAGAVVTAFAIGWWTGRYPPGAKEPAVATEPSASATPLGATTVPSPGLLPTPTATTVESTIALPPAAPPAAHTVFASGGVSPPRPSPAPFPATAAPPARRPPPEKTSTAEKPATTENPSPKAYSPNEL